MTSTGSSPARLAIDSTRTCTRVLYGCAAQYTVYLATSSSAGKRRGSAETLIAVRRQYCNTGHRVSWGAQRDALHCEEDVLLALKHVCVRRMPQHDPRRTPTRGPASPVTMNSSGETGVHGSTSVVSTSEASGNTSSRLEAADARQDARLRVRVEHRAA